MPDLFTLTCGFPTQVGELHDLPPLLLQGQRWSLTGVLQRAGSCLVWGRQVQLGRRVWPSGQVATRWGARMCKCVPSAACVKWGKVRSCWKLSLMGNPSSSQDGGLQNPQSRFSRCPGARWQASSRHSQALWAVPRAWSALRPPLLTQTAGGAEPGAWRGSRMGPRHPRKGSPVFRRSSPGIFFSTLSTVIPREESRCQPWLKTEANPETSRWACVGMDGATAGMPNTQKGTSTPIREEENCRAEAMVWPPDRGSTGGKSLLQDRPLRQSLSIFPSLVSRHRPRPGVHLFILLQREDWLGCSRTSQPPLHPDPTGPFSLHRNEKG